jgi:hypothetical protein
MVLIAVMSGAAQQSAEPDQHMIDMRVQQIVEYAIEQGSTVTPDGVKVRAMRVDVTLQEEREIKNYGERAIQPLTKFLDSPEYAGQLLAVRLLNVIGGKLTITPLSYAAEKCSAASARFSAILGLSHQPWDQVAELFKRVAANDTDPQVKRAAQLEIEKHKS